MQIRSYLKLFLKKPIIFFKWNVFITNNMNQVLFKKKKSLNYFILESLTNLQQIDPEFGVENE